MSSFVSCSRRRLSPIATITASCGICDRVASCRERECRESACRSAPDCRPACPRRRAIGASRVLRGTRGEQDVGDDEAMASGADDDDASVHAAGWSLIHLCAYTMSAPDVSAEDRALVEQVLRSSSLERRTDGARVRGRMVRAPRRRARDRRLERDGRPPSLADRRGRRARAISSSPRRSRSWPRPIAALYERAVPIFVDIDPITMNLDPSAVAQAVSALERGGSEARRWLPRAIPADLTGGALTAMRRRRRRRRVKAIVPVHVFGQPAAMSRSSTRPPVTISPSSKMRARRSARRMTVSVRARSVRRRCSDSIPTSR